MEENSTNVTTINVRPVIEDNQQYTFSKPALDLDDHFGAHIRLKRSMDEIALVEEQDMALNARQRLIRSEDTEMLLSTAMEELVVSAMETEGKGETYAADEGYEIQDGEEHICSRCLKFVPVSKAKSEQRDMSTMPTAYRIKSPPNHQPGTAFSVSVSSDACSDGEENAPSVYEGTGTSGNFGIATSTRTDRITRVASPAQRPLLYFKTGRSRRNIEELLTSMDRTRLQ